MLEKVRVSKHLVAVESCSRDIHLNHAQARTWFYDWEHGYNRNYNIDICWYYGTDAAKYTQLNELGQRTFPYPSAIIDTDDSYLGLSLKTRAICQDVVNQNYDFVTIIDSDVFCWPDKITTGDYVGRKSVHGQYLMGCFYTLSYKAAEIIANASDEEIDSPYEDVWVGSMMLKHSIPMTVDVNRVLLAKPAGLDPRPWNRITPNTSCVGELEATEMDKLVSGRPMYSKRGVYQP